MTSGFSGEASISSMSRSVNTAASSQNNKKRKNETQLTSASEMEPEDEYTSDTVEGALGEKPKRKKKEKETTTTDLLKFLETMKSEIKDNFDDAKKQFEFMSGSVKALDERITIVEKKLAHNSGQQNLAYNRELELVQIEIRKLNLIFVGLQENTEENEESLIKMIENFCSKELEVRNVKVDTAHRLGYNMNGPKHIKVRFLSLSQRNAVFIARTKLRTKRIPVFVNEDLPPQTMTRRKVLRDECSKAYKLGHKTRLLGDRLFIADIAYELNENGKLVQWKSKAKTPNVRQYPYSPTPSTSLAQTDLQEQSSQESDIPMAFATAARIPRSPIQRTADETI